jgi:hypothetical protein
MINKENWRPQGVLAWLLTVVACVLAVLMATLAYCIIYPVRWDGPGKFGAVALFFPLHLLRIWPCYIARARAQNTSVP